MDGRYSSEDVERVIWSELESGRSDFIRAETVARALGWNSALKMRRCVHARGLPTFRMLRAQAQLTYAVALIARGVKIDAAIRLAGLHNRTNFTERCKRYLGVLPAQCKNNEQLARLVLGGGRTYIK
jgi:methylphosphotriester-DNA--protein-cysteine methyltransferase